MELQLSQYQEGRMNAPLPQYVQDQLQFLDEAHSTVNKLRDQGLLKMSQNGDMIVPKTLNEQMEMMKQRSKEKASEVQLKQENEQLAKNGIAEERKRPSSMLEVNGHLQSQISNLHKSSGMVNSVILVDHPDAQN